MSFLSLVVANLFNLPLLCFLVGIGVALVKPGIRLPVNLNRALTVYILFSIGLKGGGPMAAHFSSSFLLFSTILSALIIWGLLNPLLSFYLLRSFTRVDSATAAAIGASFGSVSVMTFITAVAFLEQMQVNYEQFIIAVLAIMEIPAIISGVFIAQKFNTNPLKTPSSFMKLLQESIFNKAIIAILIGLFSGALLYSNHLSHITSSLLLSFKPLLCLFLLDMGLSVGQQKKHFRSFSWPLNFFGLYMPLIGAGFGLFLSYLLGLDAGTGTLIAVLTASASYIAVPAAMRIALPEAQEAIYLPLSLGVAFPFNVIIGIPIYYYLANWFLK